MAKLHDTRNDLSSKTRQGVAELLNQVLAHGVDMRGQLLQAHWNVRGPHFIALHELFGELTKELDAPLDEVAERIVALGGVAHGTIRMAAQASDLPDLPLEARDGLKLVALLADRAAAFGKSTRAGIAAADEMGDADTADLLTGLSRDLDRTLWKLESHLS